MHEMSPEEAHPAPPLNYNEQSRNERETGTGEPYLSEEDVERIERRHKLPEHPLSGIVWNIVKRNRLTFLARKSPEDLYQEVGAILSELGPKWGDELTLEEQRNLDNFVETIANNPQKKRDFSNAVACKLYAFTRSLGYRRERNSVKYERTESLGYDEDLTEYLLTHNTESLEEEDLHLYGLLIAQSQTAAEELGELHWPILRAYLTGMNRAEISKLLGISSAEADKVFQETVGHIRTILSADLADKVTAKLPRGKARISISSRHGAGLKPIQGKERVFVAPPSELQSVPLATLMQQFGISRATAHRLRKRGWYVPRYHEKDKKHTSDGTA